VEAFPRSLRWFTVGVFLVAAFSAAAVGRFDESFPLGAILLFGGLAALTAQRQVRLSSQVNLSPGFMVSMAAIVVSVAHGSLLGAMLVGALSNLRIDQFAKGRRGWLMFNTGTAAIAFLAAAAAYSAWHLPLRGNTAIALIAVVLAASAYLAVMWTLLILSYVAEGARPWREVLVELLPAGIEVLPFAILGFFLGRLYLDIGPVAALMIIVPILIARETFASYTRVKEAHDETVQLLVRALEQKDPYTAGHAGRVAVYAGYIGEELDFMPSRMERLRFAALMHDIGKLVVPNQLLNKPGKLTEEEFARVRVHEGVSVQMLSHIDFLRPIALHGHSDAMKFDPDNQDHPIEPYIIMVADAYDAMTSTRSYRKALPQEVAFQELREKSGKQFHPACAEALIRAIEKRNEVHGKGHEEELHFEDAPEVGLGSAGLGDLLPEDQAKK
jgi:hypothetical protein